MSDTHPSSIQPDCSSDIAVKGYIVGPVVDQNVQREFFSSVPDQLAPVQVTRMESEPPAAGMTEIATIIELINNSREVLLWGIALWHLEARKSSWRYFRRLLTNARVSKASDRVYIPLCIAVGDFHGNGAVRFYFYGDPTVQQLDRQWDEMRKLLAEMPEEQFQSSPGPQEYGFFWDYERSEWIGELFNPEQEITRRSDSWIPREIFSDIEHE